jgi:hypothetical protein
MRYAGASRVSIGKDENQVVASKPIPRKKWPGTVAQMFALLVVMALGFMPLRQAIVG